ncbi:MAG: type I-F CRISPR-associated protein Csy3 [Candidatus Thiodiazotropha sp. (ex Dulcina madagascariensis)]|nr:type I-F CRISPR-associated protein Csy3 [Candidatus Thiodiazotropha sp. (ex Dulcina madagascariensis)]
MAKHDLKTASVLAFERKLDPSDALFHAGQWDKRQEATDWPPVGMREKSVRGTISNRLKDKEQQNSAKLDADIQQPNLQTVDVATLPSGSDTLKVRFTLRVLSGAGVPSTCNNADYQAKLQETVRQYRDTQGFTELSRRYALNLANGRFLWRNRMGAEQIEIHVRHLQQGAEAAHWIFNAHDLSLRSFEAPAAFADALNELAGVIENGLEGRDHVLLEVIAFARMGDGQEIYPSQELILDRGGKKGQKSKTLYTVGDIAAMHSQKIGNALRTIDTWYPNPEGIPLGPIAVEPYGSVTSQGKAYRQPKEKSDFYNLLDNWVLKDKPPAVDQQHYVMANLIRGGVFGEKE